MKPIQKNIAMTEVGFGGSEGEWQCDGCDRRFEVEVGEEQDVFAYCTRSSRRWRVGYVYCEDCGKEEAEPFTPTSNIQEAVVDAKLLNVGDGARIGSANQIKLLEKYP